MKNYLVRIIVFLLLAAMLVVPFASCSPASKDNGEGDSSDVSDVVTDGDDSEGATTSRADRTYKYLDDNTDLKGRTYYILNCLRDQWDTISYVTSDGVNGSAINDEVYRRTEYVKKTLNCKIKEYNYHNAKLSEQFRIDFDSQLNEMALSYLQSAGDYGSIMSLMIEGRLAALDDIETIHLEEDYYVQYLTAATSVGGKHYTTASDMQINYYELASVLLFNSEMLEAKGVEFPYELVKSNKWTLEEMTTMAKQLADLNGDASWTFVSGGNAVYGISFHYNYIHSMLTALSAEYGRKDANDLPIITCQSAKFSERAEALGEFFSEPGPWLQGSGTDSTGRNPRDLFIQKRAAIVGTSLSIMSLAKESGISVGVVPMPMYDTDQEDYYCEAGRLGNFPVISSNYSDKEGIGLVLDFMSFEANRTFDQMYFVDHLELRANAEDDIALENIEMLRLIRKKITVDPMLMLGIGMDMCNAITASIEKGAGNLTSAINTHIETANADVDKIRKWYANN